MKILSYIASLLPSFDRQRIVDNIATLQADLSGTTIKAYTDAGALFSKSKFRAKVNQQFDANFHARMRDNRQVNAVAAIAKIFASLPAKLSFLESLVTSGTSVDLARDSITYQKATILKYLEVVEFTINYANRLLLSIMAAETFQNNGRPELIGTSVAPAIAEWLARYESDFLNALDVLSKPLEEVREKIMSIPDITVVPDNADVVKETVGTSKLDPLNLGFIVTTWFNPIYHARLAFSEWQVGRYKAKQEEKRAIEFRLLALEESYAKKNDPRLQAQIDYSEGRLLNLNHQLAEMEADYVV